VGRGGCGGGGSDEHPTVVKYDGTSGNAEVILLANDSDYSTSGVLYPAALAGWIGNGTSTGGTSGNKNGVFGYTDATGGAFGVVGVETAGSACGAGVRGIGGAGGNGVWGTSNGSVVSFGVAGSTDVGYGVFGTSSSGYGVIGSSSTGIDLATAGTGRILQGSYGGTGAPSSGTHSKGESVRDDNGDLYICVAFGTPGTWKKVAAIPADKLGGALVFLPKPFRIFDTRPGVAGCPIDPGVPMPSASVTTLQVTGTASTTDSTLVVPTGATGIVGDLLGINTASNGVSVPGNGFLTLQPHSGTATGNSYLHYYGDDVVQIYHNSFTIGLSSDGKLDVGNFGSTTNVGIDIMGYII